MRNSITGFLVPSSLSGSYVLNKRNTDGSFMYDSLYNRVGIDKQTSLQQLDKNYASVIDNAYSAYLSANKGILGSNMGQGYKNAYIQAQQEALNQNIAEANLNMSEARQEIELNANKNEEAVVDLFKQETGNFDRMFSELTKYREYLGTLSNETGSYLDDYSKEASIDRLYSVLFEKDPKAFSDESGNKGLSFLEWLTKNQTYSESDQAWYDWVYNQGGYNEYKTQARKKWLSLIQGDLGQVIEDAFSVGNKLSGGKIK